MTRQATIWPLSSPSHGLAEVPLRDWPAGERPDSRMYGVGQTALSDVELLALILGPATRPNPITVAQELFADGGWEGLTRLSLEELRRRPGVGRQTAARIKAALEIARRLLLMEHPERRQVRSPAEVAQLLMVEMGHLDQEQLRVVLLDTRNYVQTIHTVYIGSLNTAMVRVGELFKEAVRRNSASIILAHNHPSGEPEPSPEDVLLTRQAIEAAKLLDVECLDHLVIGRGRWISMRERGLAFTS